MTHEDLESALTNLAPARARLLAEKLLEDVREGLLQVAQSHSAGALALELSRPFTFTTDALHAASVRLHQAGWQEARDVAGQVPGDFVEVLLRLSSFLEHHGRGLRVGRVYVPWRLWVEWRAAERGCVHQGREHIPRHKERARRLGRSEGEKMALHDLVALLARRPPREEPASQEDAQADGAR